MNESLTQREGIALAQISNFFIDSWHKTTVFFTSYFTSYKFKEIIFIAKTVSVIISLILGFLIVVLLIKINFFSKVRSSLSKSKKTLSVNPQKIAKKWSKIEKRIKTGVEANYKLAVLEADEVFSDILKNLGYEAEVRITNMDEIKGLRKIKNNIVEDAGFVLTENEAQRIVDIYRKGLQDLKIL
jgi:mannitol-specific phosphotransferase system IIBC component